MKKNVYIVLEVESRYGESDIRTAITSFETNELARQEMFNRIKQSIAECPHGKEFVHVYEKSPFEYALEIEDYTSCTFQYGPNEIETSTLTEPREINLDEFLS